MSNGNAFTSSRIVLAVLAASVFATAGCDHRDAPPQTPHAAGASLLDPSDNGRQRNDPARGRIWILNARGVFLYHTSSGKLVEVTLPSWQWVDAPYSCPPDLAIGPGGEAVVTSNVVPVLWRIDPRTLTVSMHPLALDADTDKDVGFSGLSYSPEHGAYFAVSDVHGSLWRIDARLRKGEKVELSKPVQKACAITVPSALAAEKAYSRPDLCVHTQKSDQSVNLAPDQRSAYVRAMSCRAPLTHVAREGD